MRCITSCLRRTGIKWRWMNSKRLKQKGRIPGSRWSIRLTTKLRRRISDSSGLSLEGTSTVPLCTMVEWKVKWGFLSLGTKLQSSLTCYRTTACNFPHHQTKGIHVRLFEGIKILHIEQHLQNLWSHVALCTLPWVWGHVNLIGLAVMEQIRKNVYDTATAE